jgi:DDE superfamily endonuclease
VDADIVGLHLHPAQHAAVFCVNETAVLHGCSPFAQAYPFSSSRPERDNPKCYRRGILSLCATFELGIGEELGKAVSLHSSTEFVAFLTDIAVSQPDRQEIHVIADNLSAHKTVRVNDFLHARRTVHLHFVHSYTSWLGEVEQWLSKIVSDISVSGAPAPVPELKPILMRHIRHYNKERKTLKWKYLDPTRRIISEADGAVH